MLFIVLPVERAFGWVAWLHLVPQRDLPSLEWHIVSREELEREMRKGNVFLAVVFEKGLPLHSAREWSKVLREVRALMELGESLYPLDWLQWAEEDAKAVEVNLAAGVLNVAATPFSPPCHFFVSSSLGGANSRAHAVGSHRRATLTPDGARAGKRRVSHSP